MLLAAGIGKLGYVRVLSPFSSFVLLIIARPYYRELQCCLIRLPRLSSLPIFFLMFLYVAISLFTYLSLSSSPESHAVTTCVHHDFISYYIRTPYLKKNTSLVAAVACRILIFVLVLFAFLIASGSVSHKILRMTDEQWGTCKLLSVGNRKGGMLDQWLCL